MDKDKLNFITSLKEATQGILSEESIHAIETAFNEAVEQKIQLNVEAALLKQDEEYANKLKALLEAIDKDRTTKLVKIVEAVDATGAAVKDAAKDAGAAVETAGDEVKEETK